MARKLFVSIPEYWEHANKPQNFEDLMQRVSKPGGYWQVKTLDKLTGEVEVEQWVRNNWTDNAVSQMYSAVLGASNPNYTPASIMVISATLGATTLTSSIASGGTVTSITVGALTGPTIPSGTKLMIDPAGVKFNVTLTAAITGAGTFTVTSTPGPASLIASGLPVRYDYSAVPTADPTTIAAPVSYTSSMVAGQFTKTITTGFGNRQIAITNNSAYLFSTTGSPAATAASYTEAWLANASPISANNQTVLRVVLDTLLVLDATHVGQCNVTEKL